ncbi:MAG: ABC transporter ATP-binding protein, partial [Acholeplasmatales bacterium]|nr:ABC transporter ATP-binding protein [Acholeplasmatales bacterium]
MLELRNVSKFYNNNGVVSLGLKNINLSFNKGEIVAICGESGSGKSTLLNVISKIDTFDEGEIYYKGEETSYFDITDMDKFRKNKVGFIFQNYNIIESYSVLRNVMLPFEIQGLTEKEAKEKAIELIKRVGLYKRIKNKGSQLSGGEKQRCVIARALAYNCEILACDEPTGNLDSKTGKEIIDLIKEISEDKLVLIVTHNYDEIKDIATRKITVKDSEVISDEVFKEVKEEKEEYQETKESQIRFFTSLRLALQNLLYTPKRTIFTSLVLLIVGFVFLIGTLYFTYT